MGKAGQYSGCGTYGGYQQHKRAGEPSCEPCRAANAEYVRSYRAQKGVDSRQQVAYARAMARLRDAHRPEFDFYYAEERQLLGLP